MTEDRFPDGNFDKYYYYDKAEVEHYIEWWERRHPDSKMKISRLRPPTVVGPSFDNPMLKLVGGAVAAFPSTAHSFQLLHQADLASSSGYYS